MFLSNQSVDREGARSGHLVALGTGLTIPLRTALLPCSLRFRLSPPWWLLRLCWYPRRRERLGSVLFTDRVDQPFRDDLIGWHYSARAETTWDSHRYK